MDPRSPIPGPVIEGEGLRRERDLECWANQPCKFWPHHVTNVFIVLVLSGAIVAALWAWDAAQGAAV